MSFVPETVAKEVRDRLKQVEAEHAVTILFACESGSRAWGFPSANSDYDVRFIYVHPLDWYINIHHPRDVIEIPIAGDYDLSGWDLRKALALLRKSNPALQEWLSCPLIYRENVQAMAGFRNLSAAAFNPLAAFHHYLAMSKQHLCKIRDDQDVRIKHYLYTIRPLLACRYVLRSGVQPPMLFAELVAACLSDASIIAEIDQLLKLKQSAEERFTVPHSPSLDEFIISEYASLREALPPVPITKPVEPFNDVFKAILASLAS